jgi:hypothetical protein
MTTQEQSAEEKGNESDAGLLKSFSLTPVITSLFNPSAQYLGRELRDLLKSGVERLKGKKREENFAAHLKNVRDRLGEDPSFMAEQEVTITRLRIFDEWAEHVQDVDPNEEDLSAMWEGLLADAARGKDVSIEILNVLKSMTPAEAEALIRCYCGGTPWFFSGGRPRRAFAMDRFLVSSLKAKRLVEWNSFFILFAPVFLSMSLAAVVIAILPPFELFKTVMLAAVGLVLGGTISAMATLVGFFGMTWRLTWLGDELARLSTGRRT